MALYYTANVKNGLSLPVFSSPGIKIKTSRRRIDTISRTGQYEPGKKKPGSVS